MGKLESRDEYVVGGGEFLEMIRRVVDHYESLSLDSEDDRDVLVESIAANFDAIAWHRPRRWKGAK